VKNLTIRWAAHVDRLEGDKRKAYNCWYGNTLENGNLENREWCRKITLIWIKLKGVRM